MFTVVLFAAGSDPQTTAPIRALRAAHVGEIDLAARALAAHAQEASLDGATIMAIDDEKKQVGIWKYLFGNLVRYEFTRSGT